MLCLGVLHDLGSEEEDIDEEAVRSQGEDESHRDEDTPREEGTPEEEDTCRNEETLGEEETHRDEETPVEEETCSCSKCGYHRGCVCCQICYLNS